MRDLRVAEAEGVEGLVARHSSQLTQLRAEHTMQLEALRAEMAGEGARLREVHAAQLAQMAEAHASQLAALAEAHARKLAANETALRAELGAQHSAECDSLRAELSVREATARAALEEAHAAELSSLASKHEAEVEALKRRTEARERGVQEDHAAELKEAAGKAASLAAQLEVAVRERDRLGAEVGGNQVGDPMKPDALLDLFVAQVGPCTGRCACAWNSADDAFLDPYPYSTDSHTPSVCTLMQLLAVQKQLAEKAAAVEAAESQLKDVRQELEAVRAQVSEPGGCPLARQWL